MYDKTVRRRRAVLGLLVASSLILLTAYFGESAGGGLYSIQRGVLDVVSPIQEGASRALKPVRDLFGWAGDTLDAKGQLKDVRRDRDALRSSSSPRKPSCATAPSSRTSSCSTASTTSPTMRRSARG